MEIELKLALHPRHVAHIRRHPLLLETKPNQHSLLSIYFDTPQFDLMQRGIALRVRRVNNQWIQTLKAEAKSIGALTSRPEWEMAISDGSHPDFSALPQTALDLIAGIKRKHIAPIFTTEFKRTTWQLNNPISQAEVALDTGKIYVGEKFRNICEVEIELKSGVPEFLFDVADQLLQQVPLYIEPRSKAERGFLLSGAINPTPTKAIHPTIDQHQSAGEIWRAILRGALIQLVANVPGFLENGQNTEYLHQLRVALRRLRVGISLAKSLEQNPFDWKQSLRELMDALNPARDWDVFQQEILPKVVTALEHSPEQNPLENATFSLIDKAAADARQRAQISLLKPAFTQFILNIGRNLLAASVNKQTSDIQAKAKGILDKRWQQLRKRCKNFAKLDPIQRHKARIAAKKMRYTAEAFLSLYPGKRNNHFITALSALQDELGYDNDRRIAIQLLRKLPKRHTTLSFEIGRMSGVLEVEAVQQTRLSNETWQRLKRSKLFWHKPD
jgi:inorganic triphosphatase YgiF